MRVAIRFTYGHGQNGIGNHPRDHHVGADRLVVVLLGLALADTFHDDFEAISQVAKGFVVPGVDVELLRRHLKFDGVSLATDGSAKVRMDDVVTFRAPGDVVGVAECVHLESTDVGREEGEILRRGGEHMPRIKVEERHEKVETDGGSGGNDEVGEDVVAHGV